MRTRNSCLSRLTKLVALGLVVFGAAAGAAAYTYQAAYEGRIYPGVTSQGVDLGSYTRDEARATLASGFQRLAQTPIVLRYQAQEWRASPEELGILFQMQDTVEEAYAIGRRGGLLQRLGEQFDALRHGYAVDQPTVSVDQARRSAYLAGIAREVAQLPVDAQLHLRPGQQVVVLNGRPGRRLNADLTSRLIDEGVRSWGLGAGRGAHSLASSQSLAPGPVIDVAVEDVSPAVTEGDLAAPADSARKMMSAPIALKLGDQTWTLDRSQIQGWLSVRDNGVGAKPRFAVVVDEAGVRKALEGIVRETEQLPRNARFAYSGGQLKAISPGTEGRRIDVAAAVAGIRTGLLSSSRVVELPMGVVTPAIGPDDGAKLNVKELIEQASTNYDVGTAERRHNVELAASRLHGVVVPPGATFSFNDEVGEVSYRSGYKQGYGITQGSDGEILTIPSEGGGICQVATTLFHSVFWAGYPIVERHWHSYWIPRYGLPPKGLKGLDATIDQIYDKQGKLVHSVDFRFKNNTDDYLLIQARYDKKLITFQLYGVKPDWQVKVDPPKIEKEVKADTSPVEQADPKLAPGARMMIEEARDGFQATITRTVSRDGKVLEQRSFVSTYRPSRNVYLVGPKPTSTPTATPSPTPRGTAAPSPTPRGTVTPGPSPRTTPTPAKVTTPGPPPVTPTTAKPGPPAPAKPTSAKPTPAKPTPAPSPTAKNPTR